MIKRNEAMTAHGQRSETERAASSGTFTLITSSQRANNHLKLSYRHDGLLIMREIEITKGLNGYPSGLHEGYVGFANIREAEKKVKALESEGIDALIV